MPWQSAASSLTSAWRAAFDVRQGRLHFGTAIESGEELYLGRKWLDTHVHMVGPPGSGKSRLLLWLFQLLTNVPRATIILLNPKGALFRQARDFSVRRGLTKRLVLFDPGDPDWVTGYNPLQPNGLPVATHAKAVREGIRSAWGQASFDLTPQLARFLYLALAAVRERNLDLPDAASLLRPGSELRGRILPVLEDPYVKQALSYLDSLNPKRQDDLVASTLARLEAFVFDPTIRRMLTTRPALDLNEVIDQHKILLVNFELYRPLRKDDVKLLGRLLINDVVNHVFARGEGERDPVFLVIDEAALFTTHDLCDVLDLGRELGLHCVFAHQHLKQLQDEDTSGYLFDSVMTCARTKVVLGGLPVKDLEFLAPELFIDQYDPWTVKDELESLELEPIESRRESVTGGGNTARTLSRGVSHGRTETHGTNAGQTLTKGASRSRGVTRTRINGSGVSWTRGRTQGRSRTESEQSGSSSSSGSGSSSGHSSGFQSGSGIGYTVLPSGEILSSTFDSSGITQGDFSSDTGLETAGSFEASGVSTGVQESTQHSRQFGVQRSRAVGVSRGVEESESRSLTEGSSQSQGRSAEESASVGDTSGSSWSRTISPFYEYAKRRIVSSRTFLSKDEFFTLAIQKLLALPVGHFLIKVPGHQAVFARAPFVDVPKAGPRLLTSALGRVFGQAFYSRTTQLPVSEVLPVETRPTEQTLPVGRQSKRRSPLDDAIGRE